MISTLWGFAWLSVVLCSAGALDMNCTEHQLTGTACLNYMRNFISDYVLVQKEYNPMSLPVVDASWGVLPPTPTDVYTPVDVTVQVTFKDLVSVDTVSGSITASIFLDVYWKDAFMNWDPTWTPGFTTFDIDNSLIWKPDIQLYNSVGSFSEQMNVPAIFLQSDGSVWLSGPGLITFACTFDTYRFPFDKQACSANFASWLYPEYQLNITTVITTVDSSFNNLAWEVTGVSGELQKVYQWDVYKYDYAVYTISLSRYSNYYVSTAIIPSLLITGLTLLALWIRDLGSRLAMGVTGLLTLVAVQWTVSATLPVAEKSTWLTDFSNICIFYTIAVCLECYLVGYMENKKSQHLKSKALPPQWVIYMIQFSRVHRYAHEWLGEKVPYFRPSHTTTRDSTWAGVELGSVSANNGTFTNIGTAHGSNGNGAGVTFTERNPMAADAESSSAGMNGHDGHLSGHNDHHEGDSALKHRNRGDAEPHKINTSSTSTDSWDGDVGRASISPGAGAGAGSNSAEYSWASGARALDQLARVILPVSFFFVVVIFSVTYIQ